MKRSHSAIDDWEKEQDRLIQGCGRDNSEASFTDHMNDESLDSSRVASSHRSWQWLYGFFNAPSPTSPPRAPRPPSPASSSSSLPSLIIEKSQNRHDEPEEYYEALAKRARSVYRKLFIEEQCAISDDDEISDAGRMTPVEEYNASVSSGRISSPIEFSDDLAVEIQNHTDAEETVFEHRVSLANDTSIEELENTMILADTTGISDKSSHHETTEQSNDVEVNVEPEILENNGVSDKSSHHETTEQSNDVEVNVEPEILENNGVSDKSSHHETTEQSNDVEVNVQPEILENNGVSDKSSHHETTEQSNDVEVNVEPEILENNGVSDKSSHHETTEQSNDVEVNVQPEILENNGVPDYDHDQCSTETDVIEVVRAPPVHSSAGSLHSNARVHSPDDHHIELEVEPMTLGPHAEDASLQIDFGFLHRTSTPIDAHETDEQLSSGEEPATMEAATQKSPDPADVNSRILNGFFVGTPLVFNICNCAEHDCAC